MGEIHVHEFRSLDDVIDAPTWTFDYGLPAMEASLGAVTGRSRRALRRRVVYLAYRPGA